MLQGLLGKITLCFISLVLGIGLILGIRMVMVSGITLPFMTSSVQPSSTPEIPPEATAAATNAASLPTSSIIPSTTSGQLDLPLTISAPSNGLPSRLEKLTGEVKVNQRNQPYVEGIDPWRQLEDTAMPFTLVQGDQVKTGEASSTTIVVADTTELALSSTTQLNLSNLDPSHLFLNQTAGQVTYTLTGLTSISIKTQSALLELSPLTTSKVGIDEQNITVTVTAGSVRPALIDLENETQTWTIVAGQTALIDSPRRRVEIR